MLQLLMLLLLLQLLMLLVLLLPHAGAGSALQWQQCRAPWACAGKALKALWGALVAYLGALLAQPSPAWCGAC